ncbi:MAG: hypothetical protein H6850_03340 [Alphaproteobacteria bacterium]|nr:MAG: hypothetical protein H6850_03340 [Alphaproteobacteria bacterium]
MFFCLMAGIGGGLCGGSGCWGHSTSPSAPSSTSQQSFVGRLYSWWWGEQPSSVVTPAIVTTNSQADQNIDEEGEGVCCDGACTCACTTEVTLDIVGPVCLAMCLAWQPYSLYECVNKNVYAFSPYFKIAIDTVLIFFYILHQKIDFEDSIKQLVDFTGRMEAFLNLFADYQNKWIQDPENTKALFDEVGKLGAELGEEKLRRHYALGGCWSFVSKINENALRAFLTGVGALLLGVSFHYPDFKFNLEFFELSLVNFAYFWVVISNLIGDLLLQQGEFRCRAYETYTRAIEFQESIRSKEQIKPEEDLQETRTLSVDESGAVRKERERALIEGVKEKSKFSKSPYVWWGKFGVNFVADVTSALAMLLFPFLSYPCINEDFTNQEAWKKDIVTAIFYLVSRGGKMVSLDNKENEKTLVELLAAHKDAAEMLNDAVKKLRFNERLANAAKTAEVREDMEVNFGYSKEDIDEIQRANYDDLLEDANKKLAERIKWRRIIEDCALDEGLCRGEAYWNFWVDKRKWINILWVNILGYIFLTLGHIEEAAYPRNETANITIAFTTDATKYEYPWADVLRFGTFGFSWLLGWSEFVQPIIDNSKRKVREIESLRKLGEDRSKVLSINLATVNLRSADALVKVNGSPSVPGDDHASEAHRSSGSPGSSSLAYVGSTQRHRPRSGSIAHLPLALRLSPGVNDSFAGSLAFEEKGEESADECDSAKAITDQFGRLANECQRDTGTPNKKLVALFSSGIASIAMPEEDEEEMGGSNTPSAAPYKGGSDSRAPYQ